MNPPWLIPVKLEFHIQQASATKKMATYRCKRNSVISSPDIVTMVVLQAKANGPCNRAKLAKDTHCALNKV